MVFTGIRRYFRSLGYGKNRHFYLALNDHFDRCMICVDILEKSETTIKVHLDATLGKQFPKELLDWEKELLEESRSHGRP